MNTMKLARFLKGANEHYGVVDGDYLRVADGSPFGAFSIAHDRYHLEETKLLPPVQPSKIVAVGFNNRDHAEEVKSAVPDEPLFF